LQDVVNQISMLANTVKKKVELQDKDNERAKQIKGQVGQGVACGR